MYDEENAHIAQQNNEGGSHMATHNAEAHNGPANVENAQAIIEEINETLLKAFKLAIKSHNENFGPFCLISDKAYDPASSLRTDDPYNAGFEISVCFEQKQGRWGKWVNARGNLTGNLAKAFDIIGSTPEFSAAVDVNDQQNGYQHCCDTSLIHSVNVEMLYSVKSVGDLRNVLWQVKQVWREVSEAYAEKP